MTTNPNTVDLTQARHGYLADQLGRLAAEIKHLQQQKREIEDQLKIERVDACEGNLFRVTISYDVETTRVDWKAVASKLKPSRQLVTAHTSVSVADRVNVRARKGS